MGAISDNFGQKTIILFGITGSTISSYFLTQVNTIEYFYLLRFSQGIFDAAPIVLVGAIIRDRVKRNHLSQLM
ncbi:MFS transporter [Nicoletella semolina]|uniref:MFS transporter n=1 Tax=Nicoletella semolina TaxID=271160 RepID=UPI0014055F0E